MEVGGVKPSTFLSFTYFSSTKSSLFGKSYTKHTTKISINKSFT